MSTENRRYPSQTDDKFMLRLPDGMRETLKAAAKANGRSTNAEIIYRLSTWRSHAPSGNPPAAIGINVDSSQVKEALALVDQLRVAAQQAEEACRKLGIKTVGA